MRYTFFPLNNKETKLIIFASYIFDMAACFMTFKSVLFIDMVYTLLI